MKKNSLSLNPAQTQSHTFFFLEVQEAAVLVQAFFDTILIHVSINNGVV